MKLKLDQEVDRCGFLKCMQWAGDAVVRSLALLRGVPNNPTHLYVEITPENWRTK